MPMTNPLGLPLEGPPPPEITLPRAPLVSVIAQVRFPLLLAARVSERVVAFQEAIADRYPHLERQDITPINLMPMQIPQAGTEAMVHWRFSDESRQWRLTLTPEFIALETRAYESRGNFLERLEGILQALEDTLAPKLATRFGIRYIDQIKGESLARIGKLLRSEVLGVAGSLGVNARQLFTELFVPADPGDLLARWGKLPASLTLDPNLVPPITEDSWLLDLDVSKSLPSPFNTKALVTTAGLAAERVYAVFRWMVTDEFLRTYGGTI